MSKDTSAHAFFAPACFLFAKNPDKNRDLVSNRPLSKPPLSPRNPTLSGLSVTFCKHPDVWGQGVPAADPGVCAKELQKSGT
jgi:hypothetical protein